MGIVQQIPVSKNLQLQCKTYINYNAKLILEGLAEIMEPEISDTYRLHVHWQVPF